MADTVLVTSALPYANGPIHIGHLVEYIQTDIYVRFLRSCGVDVRYFCADDTHGTPIELNAAKQGLAPEVFVKRFWDEHQKDFHDFDIRFDQYGSTNSPENKKYAELIYERLKAAGDIDRRDIEQAYCETDKRFLPDRFIRGTCPNCKSPDQYGDVCEKCGKTYLPTDLIDPRCAICGRKPVLKKSTHLYFKLSRHAGFLLELIRKDSFLNQGIANQLKQFFEKGLADWDISRDGPYFGFPIPGEADKFFYVWLDAPIGYIATTEQWAKRSGTAKDALAFWARGSPGRIVHFIGKDIVYFHALFWPAVLSVADFKLPDRIVVHGHLTVNGEKMSKSRGTMVPARSYLDKLDPSYLRFFYAANLAAGPEDLDLSLSEFRLRVNADLVNNIGNLANRTLTILAGPLGGKLAPPRSSDLVSSAIKRSAEVRAAFDRLDYRSAIKIICEISQSANQFLQQQKPWDVLKTDPGRARADLSDVADVAYIVGGLVAPVVPRIAEKLFAQLGAAPLTYADIHGLDRTKPIGTPSPLIARLEDQDVSTLVQAPVEPKTPEIDYDDFGKVKLKVGKILSAERIPKADKLLKLSVDLGEGSPRTIAAGIAEAYAPEALINRNVVVVANLKPRTIRGVESKGMLLAAGAGGKDLSLVDPGNLPPGTEVK